MTPSNTPTPRLSEADRLWREFIAALDELAPAARAAFLLHEIFEASYDDIARLVGEPAGACRGHVERARAHTQARVCLRDDECRAPPR